MKKRLLVGLQSLKINEFSISFGFNVNKDSDISRVRYKPTSALNLFSIFEIKFVVTLKDVCVPKVGQSQRRVASIYLHTTG